MQPTFLEFHVPVLGEVVFPAYMTMLMVGFIVAIWLARRQADRQGMNGNHIVDLGVFMLILGIVGARLLSVLADGKLMDFVHLCTDPAQVAAVDPPTSTCHADYQCGPYFVCDADRGVCHPPRDCLAALKFWWGGLTFYGGLLLAIPGGLWFARKKGLGMARVADLTAPYIALGLFFGRLGCFFNGCCYGQPTDAFLGVRFPGHGHAVHPTQLYESAGALALFLVLRFAIQPKKRGHGEVLGWLLALYGVLRFALEFYRADERGSLGPLSTSQLISIPLVAAGVYLIVSIRRRPPAEHPSQDADPA